MLKSSGKYLDSAQLRQFQHHSVSLCKMCYVLLFWLFYSLLCGTFFSWHINSRIMIQEEQCAFRLPEQTCSCWIAMVTSVSVAQLLTRACFTCHKFICHLWPLAEIYTRGCWAQSLKSRTLTQHCQCCMICVQIESVSETVRGRATVSKNFLPVVVWQLVSRRSEEQPPWWRLRVRSHLSSGTWWRANLRSKHFILS